MATSLLSTSVAAVRNTSDLLLRSPALRTAAVLGAGGLGFAAANVLLARFLPAADFGTLSLLLSLLQVGAALAALGWPILINRHRLRASGRIFTHSFAGGVAFACVVGWVAVQVYELNVSLALLLGAAILCAAMGRNAAAFFQSRERFAVSMLLTQTLNWLLLASVPVVLLLANPAIEMIMALLIGGYLLASATGWHLASSLPSTAHAPPTTQKLVPMEMMAAALLMIGTNTFFQIDRLVVGHALPLEELAAYSIVAVVAGSMFRMLQVASGYSLAPRLRSTASHVHAVRILRREAVVVFAIAAVGAIGVAMILPVVFHRFLSKAYEVPTGVITAVIAVGFVRIWHAFAVAIVSAYGTHRQLLVLSVCGVLALLAGVVCGTQAAVFGMAAIVYGIGVGWFVFAATATVIAVSAMRNLERARSQAR